MPFSPYEIAVLYYFGELSYWSLPQVAADALGQGFDGSALRKLAAMENPVASDIRTEEVDSAFREMSVKAPIAKQDALLHLAADTARKAIAGEWNVFDAATHIKIHLCELKPPPQELERIVSLSKQAGRNAPPTDRVDLEEQLRDALSEFVRGRD